MTIAMANDHAGTQMKEEIKAYLIACRRKPSPF